MTRWSTPEALELAASVNSKDPEAAMRSHARALLHACGATSVPTPLPAVLAGADVRKVQVQPMVLEGGLRLRKGGGYTVLVREDRARTKQRFTIAHEIGHTIFCKAAPHSKAQQRALARNAPAEEERLCNVAAEELLMPAWFVDQVCDWRDDPLGATVEVQRQCDVSLPAALLRVGRLWKRRGAIQLWQYDRGWRIERSVRTNGLRVNLDSYETDEWIGRFAKEASRCDNWSRFGWLYSRQANAVVHARTFGRAVNQSKRCRRFLVYHEVLDASARVTPSAIDSYRREILKQARRTPPDRDCTHCEGSGFMLRSDRVYAICKCRKRRLQGADSHP